jgi:2-methylcitrate dehydratase PrpD
MMTRIEIEDDPSLNREHPETLASIARVETSDKRVLHHEVIYPKGNTHNPLSRQDVAAKFLDLCSNTFGAQQAEDLLKAVFVLDECDSIADVIGLLKATPE